MDVARGEKFLATRLEPTVAGVGLTLWAVPIAAAVVGDGAMSTAGAFIDMATECGGATAHDGQQDFDMRQRIQWRLRQRKVTPAVRTRSASSKSGRLIYSSGFDFPFSESESRGLAVAWR